MNNEWYSLREIFSGEFIQWLLLYAAFWVVFIAVIFAGYTVTQEWQRYTRHLCPDRGLETVILPTAYACRDPKTGQLSAE